MIGDGIKLNFDISDMAFMQGSAKSISYGKEEDFVTSLKIVLPIIYSKIPDQKFNIIYNGQNVEIHKTTILKKEDDPLLARIMSFKIGTPSNTNLDFLPVEAMTDNRGKYPAPMVTIIFRKRIATWIDDTHDTGVKMDYDYEKIQVTGPPENEEKVLAIIILNRLLKSLNIVGLKNIVYDDITLFLEAYFKKPIKKPILIKVTAFASKDAYKNAVYKYLLPNIEKSNISHILFAFQDKYEKKNIDSERELKSAIEEVIENVLKYQIEIRRWIEPFWDGQRTIKYNGSEIAIPKIPKSEPKIQPTLHVILDMALSPLGIHVIRESDEGIGSLDFRFLFTTKNGVPLSVGVEFKIAHHKKIKHGITKQLPAYLKAIKSTSGIFVVMWFKDPDIFKKPKKYEKEEMEEWIIKQAENISVETNMEISTAMLDASIRPSASNI